VLTVGVTEPHKNHKAAIEAVRLAREISGVDLRLVIVGPPGRAELEVSSLLGQLDPAGSWITRRSEVNDEELENAYNNSFALLHPALAEGFGLPVLEAAAHALPVVHSGRASLPEIVPCGVSDPEPTALAGGLVDLLTSDRYAAASKTGLEAARRQSTELFNSKVLDLIREFS